MPGTPTTNRGYPTFAGSDFGNQIDEYTAALAAALDADVADIIARLATTAMAGDLKTSIRSADHGTRPGNLFWWLRLDGREVPAAYTDLIAVLNDANVPKGPNGRPLLWDPAKRVSVAPGTGTGYALGNKGGEEKHTMDRSELPGGVGRFLTEAGSSGVPLTFANGGDYALRWHGDSSGVPMENRQLYIVDGYRFIRT